jgi:hypothetical protein
MSGCVTPSPNRCSVCGGPLQGKYANALTCSSRCRQKAYRLRAKGEVPPTCNGTAELTTFPLDAELRRGLRLLVDQGRRERIATREPKQAAADRALFANDPGRVLR